VRLLRRYAPFLVFVVAQLLIIGIAPSKAPTTVSAVGRLDKSQLDAAKARGIPTDGDKSHCVNGKQFGELATAPPCIPKFKGKNPGATYTGVTATEVKIVWYQAKENPTVTGVLRPLGLAQSREDERTYLQAAEQFINAKYELYGRKVKIVPFEGQCDYAPPDVPCLRSEAQQIAKSIKPFAVVWATAVAPEFYEELSKAKIVNAGGWHFDDSFNIQNRPYHYDIFMGGSQQAKLAGEYWCKKLAGKPARYAGDPNLRTKPRKLGIVTPDAPVNTKSAEELAGIVRKCDPNGAEISTYASDTTRAGEQSIASTARFKNDGVTTVMYFSDPIGPVFGTGAATRQQYFPEYTMAGSGLVDYDLLARLYDPKQWANAFGPSDLPEFTPFDQSDTVVVWHAAGRQGLPNKANQLGWTYLSFISAGIMGAGPTVNALNFEQALLTSDPIGGWDKVHDPKMTYVKFGPGDYTAVSDAREAYWDAKAISAIDGKPGAYVSLNGGQRYKLGEWPPGEPQLPGR
jgi:hypothetical protein